MLHLPVWGVVSLLVVCQKMWQIVLFPNKIPAGCKSGGQNLEDTDNGKGQETDIGIPLECENRLGTMLEIFGFKGLLSVLCPTTISPDGKKDINTIINKSGIQMTRIMQMLFSDLHAPRHLCFVFS